MRKKFLYLLASAAILSLASCTSTKFVPEGSYLLDEVKISYGPEEYTAFIFTNVCSSES